MLTPRSKSPVDECAPRRRLLSLPGVVGFVLLVCIGLVLLFPKRGEFITLLDASRIDLHSFAYLRSFLKANPRDEALRLELAAKQFVLGRLHDALRTLEDLRESPREETRRAAELLALDIDAQMHTPAALARRGPEGRAFEKRLRRLATENAPTRDLERMVRSALVAGRADLAATLLARLAARGPVPVRRYEDAARAALTAGEYRLAAQLYFAAQAAARTPDARRALFLDALRAYQAGNLVREGLAAAVRHQAGLVDDPDSLYFLVVYARLANRLDWAEYYARRLVRLPAPAISGTETVTPPRPARLLGQAFELVLPPARAAEPVSPAMTDNDEDILRGMRPYDERHYALSYEVFLAKGNLRDAWRVARAAVRQVPNDNRWHRRLAQVSEWVGRPDIALTEWWHLARNARDEQAWDALARLSGTMHDADTRLEVLLHQANRGSAQAADRRANPGNLSESQWRELINAYEATGRPQDAAVLLERQYARHRAPFLLTESAMLYQRMQDLDRAAAVWQNLLQRHGPNTTASVAIALIHFRLGHTRKAYDTLVRAESGAPAGDTAYWPLYAELAWQLQEHDTARRLYRTLAAQPSSRADEIGRLVALLRDSQPEAAARFALDGYRRFNTPALLMTALDLLSRSADPAGLDRLLATLTPEDRARVADKPQYWLLRAEAAERTGRHPESIAHHERAMSLRPGDVTLLTSYLWRLIDLQAHTRLRLALSLTGPQARHSEPLREAMAAAWAMLGEPVKASALYRPLAKRHASDPLWLLNYAEIVAATGEPAAALALRQQAHRQLAKLGQAQPALVETRGLKRELLALVRLESGLRPGDAAARLHAAVIRRLDDQPPGSDRSVTTAAEELILSWFAERDELDAARRFRLRMLVRGHTIPWPLEVTLALADNDHDALSQRITTGAPTGDADVAAGLTPAARTEIADRLGLAGLARLSAHTALAAGPDLADEKTGAQARFVALAVPAARHVGGEIETQALGALDITQHGIEAATPLSAEVMLTVAAREQRQTSDDLSVLAMAPSPDRLVLLDLELRGHDRAGHLAVSRRSALGTFSSLRFSAEKQWRERHRLTFDWLRHTEADESTPLRVGGMKNGVLLAWQTQLGLRDRVELQRGDYRFLGQDDTRLGQGAQWRLAGVHVVRHAWPSLALRLEKTRWHTTADGAVSAQLATLIPAGQAITPTFFLPPTQSQLGISVSLGGLANDIHTRAWRPYADLGLFDNTVSGSGYTLLAGLRGSPTGQDQLHVHVSRSEGQRGRSEVDHRVSLAYRYYFN